MSWQQPNQINEALEYSREAGERAKWQVSVTIEDSVPACIGGKINQWYLEKLETGGEMSFSVTMTTVAVHVSTVKR